MTHDTPHGGLDQGRSVVREKVRAAMTQVRGETTAPPTVADFARVYRYNTQPLADHLISTIQSSVPAYRTGVSTEVIREAVSGALVVFTEALFSPSPTGPKVDRLFQRIGHDEAARDGQLTDLFRAFYVSVREASICLHKSVQDFGLDVGAVDHINTSLFVYADHLADQVLKGRDVAVERVGPRPQLRESLLQALLDADDQAFALAEQTDWPIPAEVVVLATSGARSPSAAPTTFLTNADHSTLVAAADDVDQAIAYLQRISPKGRVAVSWPVPPQEIGAAVRWTKKLIELARHGVVEDQTILRVKDHSTTIWLQSESELREHLYQDLLQPLLAAQKTPRMGYIMSQTLLAFLEGRGRYGQREIAHDLGIHVNSFRHRMKGIEKFYGEALSDDGFTLQLHMALKATVDLWKAEDPGDNEDLVDETLGQGD